MKEPADHCTRWRIPAQSASEGAAARAKRTLVCYLGGHELPSEQQSVMSIVLGMEPGPRLTGDEAVSRPQASMAERP
ncbi:conserved hypothetical protein [Aeromonas salmonicida]|nr:conserved hypothetical protein [Aeromonas salmonicida]